MTKPVDGAEARYLLVKRDLYYRPDSRGYTGIKSHAGRYLASDAAPDSGVTAIHEDDAPMFSPACWEDLKIDHLLSLIAEREKASAVLVAENERLREALTPSGATKAAYIGEFSFTVMNRDEDGEEVPRRVLVPWDTTKEIMAAILARTALETRNG